MDPRTRLTQLHFRQVVSWSIIISGILLPWLTKVIAQTFYDPQNFLSHAASFYPFLFSPKDPLLLVALLNAIPFGILAICIRWRLRLQHRMESSVFFPAVTGLVGMMGLVFSLNLYVYITVWAKVFGGGTLSNQTLAPFLAVPFYTLVLMPISYVIGWMCGKFFVAHE